MKQTEKTTNDYRKEAAQEQIDYSRKVFAECCESTAKYFEDIATTIRRKSVLDAGYSAVEATGAIVHAVLWGVANANVDTLHSYAKSVIDAEQHLAALAAAQPVK